MLCSIVFSRLEAQQHPPQGDLVAVSQCTRLEGKHPLTVDQGAVDTIKVFDQHLSALHEDTRMASPDA
jgi:hypothetical protein